MATICVIFPAGKKSSADAYKAWADLQQQAVSGTPGDVFTLVAEDRHGQWKTAYFGPPYVYDDAQGEISEPTDGPAMRADGVVAINWDPPEDE